MTRKEMIARLRAEISKRLEARAARETELDEARTGVESITADVEQRDDKSLTDDETAAVEQFRTTATDARAAIATIDTENAESETRAAELEDEQQRSDAAAALAARYGGESRPEIRGGAEPVTYDARAEHSFFVDSYRSQQLNDMQAQQRLARHDVEMRAAVTSAAFGGLIVPLYLVEEFAHILHNGRPFANAMNQLPLPDEGLILTIPRGQTGASVASQATENATVSETAVDYDNDLAVNVRTIAGSQGVSRQSLERGTPGIDRLIYQDLVGAYASELDLQLINGAGTSGTHKGVLNATGISAVTYTDVTPTVPELRPKMVDAHQQVITKRKRAGGGLLWLMHPRRWGFLIAAVDSQNRPLYVAPAQGPYNSAGVQRAFELGMIVGEIDNVPVMTDGNMPITLGTNEDAIALVRTEDALLWEEGDGMPRELRFEETNGKDLTIDLVVYGYSAATFERHPEAFAKITGTGLITPTF